MLKTSRCVICKPEESESLPALGTLHWLSLTSNLPGGGQREFLNGHQYDIVTIHYNNQLTQKLLK